MERFSLDRITVPSMGPDITGRAGLGGASLLDINRRMPIMGVDRADLGSGTSLGVGNGGDFFPRRDVGSEISKF